MTTMSSSPNGDGPSEDAASSDLSSAFGAAAATSLRGILPSRQKADPKVEESPAVVDERDGLDSDSARPEPVEEDVQDSNNRPASLAARTGAPPAPAAHGPSGAPGPSDMAATPRRLRTVRVRDRQHISMLLLAVAAKGPARGREITELVRKSSGGVFKLSEGTVFRELHRLRDDQLLRVTRSGGVHRYSLTPLGRRILATRRREWEAFSNGLDRVLEAADGSSRSEVATSSPAASRM